MDHESVDIDRLNQKTYYLAARFDKPTESVRAYGYAQQAIFFHDCDLSAYRFRWEQRYHVTVLGTRPPETLDRRLRAILARGEMVALPDDLLRFLAQRRREANEQAPWVEGHYPDDAEQP